MNLTFLAKLFVLIILGLGVVFVIEPLDPSTTSAPFLFGIILMALSLRQSASLVVVTSLIYCVMTVYDLITFVDYVSTHLHPVLHPVFWLFQRMGLFLVVSGLATYLAYYRVNTQTMLGHVQNILAKLPAPVMISDATGIILYTNESLATIFKQKSGKLIGQRYVEVMMSDIQEGKAMRYYIELFGGQENSIHELEIKPFNHDTKVKARLTCFGSGTSRVLITLFDVVEPIESIEDLLTPAVTKSRSASA